MANEKDYTTSRGLSQVAQAVNRSISNLDKCGANVRELIATIQKSRVSAGDEEPISRDVLHVKIDALKNLSALCTRGTKRLSALAVKLASDRTQQGVFSEVTAISRFISDQLQSEKEDIRRILNTTTGPNV